jgi:tRNA A37 methylthiotransferase MiaB
MLPPSFFVDNLGCHLRSHDAEKIKNHLLGNKLRYTELYEEANIVIVTGCLADTVKLDHSNRQITKHIESGKKIVLTGCISENVVQSLKDHVMFIPPRHLEKIDKIIDDIYIPFHEAGENHRIFPSESSRIYYQSIQKYTYNHTFFRKLFKNLYHRLIFKKSKPENLFFIKIGTGCAFNCSFCNTKFCFDGVISKPLQHIKNEYRELISMKAGEVVFISEDIGSYGADTGTNLIEMLANLNKSVPYNKIKWHLDALNPYWSIQYRDKLIELIRKKKIKSIVFTIQSGSSRILNLMNRYNDVEKIEKNIKELKKTCPAMKLSGFFMVGFPSETEYEFGETLDFIKKIKFDEVFISCYSEFEHCQSAKIFPKVPQEEIMRRYVFAKQHLERYNIFCKN